MADGSTHISSLSAAANAANAAGYRQHKASAETRKARQQRWTSNGVGTEIQTAVLNQLAGGGGGGGGGGGDAGAGGAGGGGGRPSEMPITFGFLNTYANAASIQALHAEVVYNARDRVTARAKQVQHCPTGISSSLNSRVLMVSHGPCVTGSAAPNQSCSWGAGSKLPHLC